MSYPEAMRRFWAARDSDAPPGEDFFGALERGIRDEIRRTPPFRIAGHGSAIFPRSMANIPAGAEEGIYYPDSRTIIGISRGSNVLSRTIEGGFQTHIDPVFARLFTGLHETFHRYTSDDYSRFSRIAVRNTYEGHPEVERMRDTFGRISPFLSERMTEGDISPTGNFQGLIKEIHADLATHLWLSSNMQRNGQVDPFIAQNLQRFGMFRALSLRSQTHNTAYMLTLADGMSRSGQVPFGINMETANTIAIQLIRDNINVIAAQYLAGKSLLERKPGDPIPHNSAIDRLLFMEEIGTRQRYHDAAFFFGGAAALPRLQNPITPFISDILRSNPDLARRLQQSRGSLTGNPDGSMSLGITGTDGTFLSISRSPAGEFRGEIRTRDGQRSRTTAIPPARAEEMFAAIPREVVVATTHPAARGVPTQVGAAPVPPAPEATEPRTQPRPVAPVAPTAPR